MATGKYVKYPRTPLLPWSPKKDDDFRAVDCSAFEGGGGRRHRKNGRGEHDPISGSLPRAIDRFGLPSVSIVSRATPRPNRP